MRIDIITVKNRTKRFWFWRQRKNQQYNTNNNSNKLLFVVDFNRLLSFCPQVYRGHAADQVRQTQKQPTRVADNRTGVGHQRGNRQPDRTGTEQHAGPDAGPMSLLQFEFHHLLVLVLVLHTVHHHGVSLLEHIQGECETRGMTIRKGAIYTCGGEGQTELGYLTMMTR